MLSAGTGTLTVMSTKQLSTNGQQLSITANDADFQGAVSSGIEWTSIECTTGGRVVTLGEPGYTGHLYE